MDFFSGLCVGGLDEEVHAKVAQKKLDFFWKISHNFVNPQVWGFFAQS